MSIVKGARKEVLVTMSLAEEERIPLPEEYFILLEQKLKKGIRMRRLLFGSRSFSERKFPGQENKNYQHRLSAGNYKRMLLVDRKELLFVKATKGLRKYWYSTDSIEIKYFLNYFKEKWRDSKKI